MVTGIIPKLPMRNLSVTRDYYVSKLQFSVSGVDEFDHYLMVEKDGLEIHFFEFKELDPAENYGQVYIRTDKVDELFKWMLENSVEIHPNGYLENKPWRQREFSLLDPDNNLLTFGQSIEAYR